MKRWNMVIDVARCHDCNNCFLADKDEFVGNDWPPYSAAQPWSGHRWLNIERKERGQFPQVKVAYLPLACQHCDEAPCIRDSPAGAVYKRPDGLVIIDPAKAKGRKEIVGTCPYGVIYWNEEAQVPQKCTGCAHLLDQGWKDTRCAQVCPTEALQLVLAEDEEMRKLAAAQGLEVYLPELGTKPRIYFKNLHLWTKVFLAGSVAYKDGGACADGVKVTVSHDGSPPMNAQTNNYGDFLIDGLAPDRNYTLTIEAPGYRTLQSAVTVKADSLTLPAVFLEKA
jgi:Fe-S-cluster-containing dehydrogenase component